MSALPLTERACCSDLKTEKVCSDCIRNVDLPEADMYEYWVEPILIKSFKDGIDTKCSSYLKTKYYP